jgi:hypothetical protein
MNLDNFHHIVILPIVPRWLSADSPVSVLTFAGVFKHPVILKLKAVG